MSEMLTSIPFIKRVVFGLWNVQGLWTLAYTGQNSYSISHLQGIVTKQWPDSDSDSVVTVDNCQHHSADTVVDELCSHRVVCS